MTYDLAVTYLTIAGMLIFVLFPILILASVSAVHAVASRRRTNQPPARTAGYSRRAARRRLAVPATT